MADSNCSYILLRLQNIQDRTAECDRELRAIASRRYEYEEKLADVNARLDETLKGLYSSQSTVDQSALQKIVNYGRELEKLEINYKAGLKDAEVTYKHRIAAVWKRFCQELIATLGPTLVQETLQKLADKDAQQYLPNSSIEDLQKNSASEAPAHPAIEKAGINGDIKNAKRKRRLSSLASLRGKKMRNIDEDESDKEENMVVARHSQERAGPESQGQVRDNQVTEGGERQKRDKAEAITPGEVYFTFWEKSNAWSAVLLLPTENIHDVGVPYTAEALGLANDVPECYDYNLKEKRFQWREGYEEGGRLVTERQHPVMYFDGLGFSRKSPVGWVAAKDLQSFDLNDARVRKLIEHAGHVRKFLREQGKLRTKAKPDTEHTARRATPVNGTSILSDIENGGDLQPHHSALETNCGRINHSQPDERRSFMPGEHSTCCSTPSPEPGREAWLSSHGFEKSRNRDELFESSRLELNAKQQQYLAQVQAQEQQQQQKQEHAGPANGNFAQGASGVTKNVVGLAGQARSPEAADISDRLNVPDHILEHAGKITFRTPMQLAYKSPSDKANWFEEMKYRYARTLYVMQRSKNKVAGTEKQFKERAQGCKPLEGEELRQYQLRREEQLKFYTEAHKWIEDVRKQQDILQGNNQQAGKNGAASSAAKRSVQETDTTHPANTNVAHNQSQTMNQNIQALTTSSESKIELDNGSPIVERTGLTRICVNESPIAGVAWMEPDVADATERTASVNSERNLRSPSLSPLMDKSRPDESRQLPSEEHQPGLSHSIDEVRVAAEVDKAVPSVEGSAFAETSNDLCSDGSQLASLARRGLILVDATLSEALQTPLPRREERSPAPLPTGNDQHEPSSLQVFSTWTDQRGEVTRQSELRTSAIVSPRPQAPIHTSKQWSVTTKIWPPTLHDDNKSTLVEIPSSSGQASPVETQDQISSLPRGAAWNGPGRCVRTSAAAVPRASYQADTHLHITAISAAILDSQRPAYSAESWPESLPQHLFERLIEASRRDVPTPDTFKDRGKYYHCPFYNKKWQRPTWFTRHLLRDH